MKILMVDDSPVDRKLCRKLLEETHGSEFEFFEEGAAERGLETCRYVSPDCLLLDYQLPDMTGLEFLACLRASEPPGEPGFAVVMVTGMASEQVAVAALKAGAQGYLVKDRLTAEGLSQTIEQAMERISLVHALKAERDQLARSLAEKEVLLKEVHHRVKNNLQVIASLLRLQADKVTSDVAAPALRDSQHRVESMALIHEQLYETEDLREVDLAKYASLLATNLLHSLGVDRDRIECRVTIEPLLLGVDQAIPAGLILNELISNALKHAFPNGRSGFISVEGGQRDASIVLNVRDNGAGIPADIEVRKSKSLGLEIVKILSRQLKGIFEMERGEGALFRVSFPSASPNPSQALSNSSQNLSNSTQNRETGIPEPCNP